MVTFVPGFVSQECADWTAGLKAEAARRGLDPKDFAQLFSIKSEWERAHPLPRATLAQVADHVDHVRAVAGVAHVGLGGDFDGTPDVTVGLEDVSDLPGAVRRTAGPRLDRIRLRRPGRRQRPARPARGRVLRRVRHRSGPGLTRTPLSSDPMTSDTLPAGAVAAGPTVLRPTSAGLALLTWPVLDASGADAAVTARSGGVSSGPYATLNLSLSVGDDPGCVRENRHRLAAGFGASLEDFVFARQVHGAGVRVVGAADRGSGAFGLDDAIADVDALVTRTPGVVLAILTADCVPIVLHDPVAGVLACVHAGWRGTAAGVSAAALAAMQGLGSSPADVIAGIGPAIAAARYQVGPDVHQAVTRAFGPPAASFLRPDLRRTSPSGSGPDRWLLDLWAANRHALVEAGVPAAQIHTTTLPTGPFTTDPTSPATTDPTSPASPTAPSPFFSDRTARPCGRLALVARLRAPGGIGMDVTT